MMQTPILLLDSNLEGFRSSCFPLVDIFFELCPPRLLSRVPLHPSIPIPPGNRDSVMRFAGLFGESEQTVLVLSRDLDEWHRRCLG